MSHSTTKIQGIHIPASNCSQNCAAIDDIFRRHNGWLMSWLRKQRWTASCIEDTASDVFVALLTMPNLSAVREPRAMMTTIARRLIFDSRRRNDLRRSYEADLAALPQSLEISAEERLLAAQALQAIAAMLATLSPKARTAFLRAQVEGMGYAEIAEELGVSVSMVRKYVAQGLRAAYLASARQG